MGNGYQNGAQVCPSSGSRATRVSTWLLFVQEYYQSAGEPLPEGSQRIRKQGGDDGAHETGKDVDADILQRVSGQWGPWLNHGDHLHGVDDDEYDPDRPVTDTAHMFTLTCDRAVVCLVVC